MGDAIAEPIRIALPALAAADDLAAAECQNGADAGMLARVGHAGARTAGRGAALRAL